MARAFSPKITEKKRKGKQAASVERVRAAETAWKPFDWQKKVLESTEDMNVVICAGRQVGKTELAIMKAWMAAAGGENRTVWWISPTLRQCRRDILPRALKMFKKEELFDSVVVTDMIMYLHNGSRIIFLSGEQQHADHLLGATLDHCILDEAARLDRKIWEQYIEPMLVVRNAKVWMISTPLGRNWFYEAWMWGKNESMQDWASFHTPSTESPLIGKKLEVIKQRTPKDVFEQEYLAKFTDSAGGAFFGIGGCEDNYRLPVEFDAKKSYVCGVDVARKNDFTVILVMDDDGRVVYVDRCQDVSFEQQKARIHLAVKKYGECPVWIDATGLGSSVFEALRNSGLKIDGINLDYKTKAEIIQHLGFKIETESVIYPLGHILIEELQNYQFKRSPTGLVKYEAAPGHHDDCVIALALAVWGKRKSGGTGLWVF